MDSVSCFSDFVLVTHPPQRSHGPLWANHSDLISPVSGSFNIWAEIKFWPKRSEMSLCREPKGRATLLSCWKLSCLRVWQPSCDREDRWFEDKLMLDQKGGKGLRSWSPFTLGHILLYEIRIFPHFELKFWIEISVTGSWKPLTMWSNMLKR